MTSPVFYTGALRPRWVAPLPTIPASLKEKVIGWWEFEEPSGLQISNSSKSMIAAPLTATPPNLVAVNSTPDRISSGKYGQALRVDNNPTRVNYPGYLQHINMSPTVITIWHNRDTTRADTGIGAYNALFGRYYNSGANRQWALAVSQFTSGGPLKYTLMLSTNGSALTDTLEGPVYDRTTSGWDFIVVTLNPITGTVSIQINNGTVYSKTTSFPLNITTPGVFGIGGYFDSGGTLMTNGAWKVSFDNLAIFDDVLTTDELTALYNSGMGLRYSDLPSGSNTDLIIGCTNYTASTATSSFSMAVPAGAAAGDTLVAILRCRGDFTFSVPSGWTSRFASVVPSTYPGNSGDSRIYILTKAYASETSVTFTLSGSSGCGLMLAVIRGTLGTPVMGDGPTVNITKGANNSNLLVVPISTDTPMREPYNFGRYVSQSVLKGYTGFLSSPKYYRCATLENIVNMSAGVKTLRSSWVQGAYPANHCVLAMEAFPL